MITLTPFEDEFCGKTEIIYSVNYTTPEKFRSSITTHSYCSNCGEGNFFRVYEPMREYETEEVVGEIYKCKCPSCKSKFNIINELEKDEND